MSFTREVREELAHTDAGSEACSLAEASALLRFGGALQIRGPSGIGYVVDTDVGAVARRLRTTLDSLLGTVPSLEAHRPTGLRSATVLRLRLGTESVPALQRLGILTPDGRPAADVARRLTSSGAAAAAYVRGAVMVAGSLSDPRKPPHLELRAPGETAARGLADLAVRCGLRGARAGDHGGWRVTAKSGAAIGALLARLGAHTAFLRWDGERLRRELRGDANRAANADRANVSRAVAAGTRQAAVIERLVGHPRWDELRDDVRAVGLARIASPEATLAELGALLDPPVGKSTVHRRLSALLTAAEEFAPSPGWVE